MEAVLGIVGSVVLAIVAFVLGRLNLDRQVRIDREESLRRTRLECYSSLCAAIVDYRRAQLHRWHVGQDIGTPADVERERPEIANELRITRAKAWSEFYRTVMICDDDGLEARARAALELTKSMKHATTAEELDEVSDRVHIAVDELARHAGRSVTAIAPRPLGPAPRWSGGAG